MSKTLLQPYLNFNGNAREAMTFYQKVLGGELEIRTFGEFNSPVPNDYQDKTMHAVLKNDTLTFMASDGRPDVPVVFGDSMYMSLSGDNAEQLAGFFNALGDGGEVTMPLEKQVWGDQFGMLTDKFGVHWMVNITAPK